jgi:hypothetical protein
MSYNINIPKCKGGKKSLCSDMECKICHENNTYDISYYRSFASCERSIMFSPKNGLDPRSLNRYSQYEYIFYCEKCNHEYIRSLALINHDKECIFCSKSQLCDKKDCKMCDDNSFKSSEKAIYWSPKNKITPRKIFRCTAKKYLFDCVCGHELLTSPIYISRGRWCKFCGHQAVCQNSECNFCLNNSFKSHPNSSLWSPKNKVKPRNVLKHSAKKYLFDCICGHEIYASLDKMTKNGKVLPCCSFCQGISLCENSKCNFCFNNSFANSHYSKYWSEEHNDGLSSRFVTKYSNKKCNFKCPFCENIFNTSVSNLSLSLGICSCRRLKSELKMYNFLIEYFPNIKRQKRPEWLEQKYSFDFYLEEFSMFIELDGLFHFKDVIAGWDGYKKTSERDEHKMKKSIENNHIILRIYQEDVHYDLNDWKTNLLLAIKYYKIPVVIGLSDIYYVNYSGDSVIYICNHISFCVNYYYLRTKSNLLTYLEEINIDYQNLINELLKDFCIELNKLITKCYDEEVRRTIFLLVFAKINKYEGRGKKVRDCDQFITHCNRFLP